MATDRGQDIVAVIDNDEGGRIWRDDLTALLADEGHTLTVVEPPATGLDLNAWSFQEPLWAASLPLRAIDSVAL